MNDKVENVKKYLLYKYHKLVDQLDELDSYIDLKQKQQDYHAISDAANDMRELEAEIDLINDILERLE